MVIIIQSSQSKKIIYWSEVTVYRFRQFVPNYGIEKTLLHNFSGPIFTNLRLAVYSLFHNLHPCKFWPANIYHYHVCDKHDYQEIHVIILYDNHT